MDTSFAIEQWLFPLFPPFSFLSTVPRDTADQGIQPTGRPTAFIGSGPKESPHRSLTQGRRLPEPLLNAALFLGTLKCFGPLYLGKGPCPSPPRSPSSFHHRSLGVH